MSGITLMVLGSGGSLPLPVNSVAPVVSGTAQSGQTLSSTTGTWVGVVDNYSYQWQRGAGASYSNISGATGSTYTVTSGDAGYLLRCQVRATNVTGTSDPASSNATALVPGQVVLSVSGGTQNWVVPPAVTSVSYMLVGRGGQTNAISNQVTPGRGGGGGASVYSNNASVSGGSTLTVYFAFIVLGVLLTKELILTGLLQREETDRGPTVPVETQLIVMAVQLILRATAVLMEQGRVLALRAIAVVAVMVVVKTQRGLVVLAAQAAVREVHHPTLLVAAQAAAV